MASNDRRQIVDSIQDHLKRYMVFANDDQPLVLALWVLHTWTFKADFPRKPWTTPYLYVHSAQKRSGKTLLIDILETLALNPERTVDMTSSVLFRLIETVQPTLFIDEVDTIWSGARNEALRGVLNGGYKHGGTVWRVEAGEPTKFATFCPKLLAGIDNGLLPDTIADRSIPIALKRAPANPGTEVYYSFQAGPQAEVLQTDILDWIDCHAPQIVEYLPKPVDGISPRAFEIATPLLQIAHAAGIEADATEAIRRLLTPVADKDTPEVAVLRHCFERFEELEVDRLHTETLLEGSDGLTGRKLGSILSRFEIMPERNPIMIAGKLQRGYLRRSFTDAWERYL